MENTGEHGDHWRTWRSLESGENWRTVAKIRDRGENWRPWRNLETVAKIGDLWRKLESVKSAKHCTDETWGAFYPEMFVHA